MRIAAAIFLALPGLMLAGAQEAPLPPLETAEPPESEAETEPLRVLVTPQRLEEMADTIPDWAEIPLGNGEVGNLLGFLERTLEHDPDFRLSELMREAKRALMPELPIRAPAPVTVAEVDTGLIMGGAYLGLKPEEVRLRLGVREDIYARANTARGIYGAVNPAWCPTGPLNCVSYTFGARAPIFETLLGEE